MRCALGLIGCCFAQLLLMLIREFPPLSLVFCHRSSDAWMSAPYINTVSPAKKASVVEYEKDDPGGWCHASDSLGGLLYLPYGRSSHQLTYKRWGEMRMGGRRDGVLKCINWRKKRLKSPLHKLEQPFLRGDFFIYIFIRWGGISPVKNRRNEQSIQLGLGSWCPFFSLDSGKWNVPPAVFLERAWSQRDVCFTSVRGETMKKGASLPDPP